ncbi:type VII secretion-associated serine protease mycosin [Streptomyces exfoliatus]|uniref:type VII secretion-associated serine protease mycosin n=1 Tax=Streptomyces exfoliatus TaxID=1905 RepID=UPI0004C6E3C5|nr:type VII secretion-associated serine protease mycosin [Streptomyces exfoliatus]
MRTSSIRRSRARVTASAALGMLLVGIASAPAHAEGVRDRQWHLTAMGAEKIWQLSTGKGVTVAVIDSGVDQRNPDLRGQILKGKDLAPDEEGDEFTDYTGHGTGMAGLIAGTGEADGGNGAFGLAPGAKILPVRVPGSGGGNKSQAQADREFNRYMPEAIRFAADAGAKVINISQGVTTGSQQLTDAVKYALDKGALVFAAVGNTGDKSNKLEYPGATPGVVGVGAVDQKVKHVPMSQIGPQVDIAAPGSDMVAACGTGICTSTGTSDASALASAAAALVWSKHPDWTNNQVLKVMLNTISSPTEGPKRSDFIGYGAIRPLRMLKTPGDPGPADVRPIDDLKEIAAGTPSASTSATDPSSSSPAPSESSAAPAPAPQAAAEDSGNTGLWIGLGIGVAVLIGAAVAVFVLRSRRG